MQDVNNNDLNLPPPKDYLKEFTDLKGGELILQKDFLEIVKNRNNEFFDWLKNNTVIIAACKESVIALPVNLKQDEIHKRFIKLCDSEENINMSDRYSIEIVVNSDNYQNMLEEYLNVNFFHQNIDVRAFIRRNDDKNIFFF